MVITQRFNVTAGTTVVTTDFELNHNPYARKAYFHFDTTSGTLNVKTILARMNSTAPWFQIATPAAASNTYTEVDLYPEYRFQLGTASGTAVVSIGVVN